MRIIKTSTYILLLAVIVVIGTVSLGLTGQTYPAPKELSAYNATAEKGRYLAKAGNCQTCHTVEHGEPFAGGLPFKTDFGLLHSTNITPDKNTGIGEWSFADFYHSMKQGIRPDGSHLYPAFPYTDFAKMTDEDIASLFLYLKTIEPVNQANQENHLQFPYSIRPLLSFWKILFHDAETFEYDPNKSDAWNRGAYLVEGPGHCGACHTPRNFLGAEQAHLALTGGIYHDKVKLGFYRKWSAVNLTPAPTGLANVPEEELVDYLKNGVANDAVVHGPMIEVVMNSTSHLQDQDLQAIATYLKNIPANEQSSGPIATDEEMASGEIGYTVHCGGCHLPTGLGDPVLGVSLAGSAIVQAADPASLINVILYGPHLPAPPFVVDRTRMKMYGKRLSDRDIADISSYIRASFGNSAGAVSPEQVKVQR